MAEMRRAREINGIILINLAALLRAMCGGGKMSPLGNVRLSHNTIANHRRGVAQAALLLIFCH